MEACAGGGGGLISWKNVYPEIKPAYYSALCVGQERRPVRGQEQPSQGYDPHLTQTLLARGWFGRKRGFPLLAKFPHVLWTRQGAQGSALEPEGGLLSVTVRRRPSVHGGPARADP